MHYYDEDYFNQSSTYNSWVRLLCADLDTLETFSSVFGRRVRPGYGVKSEDVYIFQNHPVNYVTLVATCASLEELYVKWDSGMRNRVFVCKF